MALRSSTIVLLITKIRTYSNTLAMTWSIETPVMTIVLATARSTITSENKTKARSKLSRIEKKRHTIMLACINLEGLVKVTFLCPRVASPEVGQFTYIVLTCKLFVRDFICWSFLVLAQVNHNHTDDHVPNIEQLPDIGAEDTDMSCGLLQRIRHRRMRKRALHASLRNPKDLFWDAVWVQPEDIIREVTLDCQALPVGMCERQFVSPTLSLRGMAVVACTCLPNCTHRAV